MGAKSQAAPSTEAGGNGVGDGVVAEADRRTPTLDGLSISRGSEQLERAERLPPETSDTTAGEEELAEPQLLVPIDRTPLPEVDQAMPVLSLFPAVVGRRHGRYKVALLKTLQGRRRRTLEGQAGPGRRLLARAERRRRARP